MKYQGLKIISLMLGLMMTTPIGLASSGGDNHHLMSSPHDLRNKASLQRGGALFMNYCAGCHSLKHVRYNQLGEYLGIAPWSGLDAEDYEEQKQQFQDMIQNNLNFVSDKVIDPIVNSMSRSDSAAWFGNPPPDLTLVTRVRGADWVYSYLKSFYKDDSRPWGVNNLIFPDVGMPHALVNLQGLATPVYETKLVKNEDGTTREDRVITHLELTEVGELDDKAYDTAITDLVNFLSFVAEPVKLKRENVGFYVLLFFTILIVLTYLLKREFWKDVR